MSTSSPSVTPELYYEARESLYATGHALFQQERYAEAAAVFRIMLQVAPTDERSWLALGECHERAGQRDVALELYAAGVAAIDNAARCAFACFRIFYDDGNATQADQLFDVAMAAAERCDDQDLIDRLAKERTFRP